MNEEDVEDNIIVAHSLTLIGKEAYSLLKTLASPEMPITFPYLTLKELLIDYVKYTNFKCDMVCSNDSHTSDEISYKSEENMLGESNRDRKPDAVLIDADFSNDPLLRNDILNTFE
ncbi:unnamed protein product [Schistosoma mattheei]|uniref:Uncharacterized protein n=1 Tax=Schistosoma mattheei TaxID=31246 RepID=A0A183P745_9TREM|nr:unnamed protein product [Schistosoma mattheei]